MIYVEKENRMQSKTPVTDTIWNENVGHDGDSDEFLAAEMKDLCEQFEIENKRMANEIAEFNRQIESGRLIPDEIALDFELNASFKKYRHIALFLLREFAKDAFARRGRSD